MSRQDGRIESEETAAGGGETHPGRLVSAQK